MPRGKDSPSKTARKIKRETKRKTVSINPKYKDIVLPLEIPVKMTKSATGAVRAGERPSKRVRAVVPSSTKASTAEIALAMMLPGDARPVRFRDEMTSEESAVARLFDRPIPDWNDQAADAGLGPMAATECMTAVFRNPLRAYVYEDKNTSNAPASQTWITYDTFARPTTDFTFSTAQTSAEVQDPEVDGATPDLTQWHGPMLYAGRFNGRRYIWCDSPKNNALVANGVLNVYAGTIVHDAEIAIELWAFNGGNPILINQVMTTTVAAVPGQNIAALLIGNPDYYTVRIGTTAGAAAVADFQFNLRFQNQCANCPIFRHNAAPQFFVNQKSVSDIRVIGASALISNRTPLLTRGGNIVGYQPPNSTSWSTYISQITVSPALSAYQIVSALKGSVVMGFDKGMYGYVKFEDIDEAQYQHSIHRNFMGVDDTSYDLVGGGYLIIIAKHPDGAANSQTVQLSFDFTIEYTTENQWVDTNIATTSPEEWRNALMIVASTPQFFENPIHWDVIRKSIGTLAKIGGGILSAIPTLSGLAPLAGGLGDWLGHYL